MRKSLVIAASLASLTAFCSTSYDLGYVTNGLTAHWDAIDNQADGTHSASATTWVDLVGGAAFAMSGTTWGDEYCRFPTAASCGSLSGSSLLAWDTTVSTARTVEVVLKFDSATDNGICFMGTSGSKIAIGRYNNGTQWIVSTASALMVNGTMNHTDFGSVSFGFVKGGVLEGYLYNNTNAVTKASTSQSWGSANSTICVGSRSGGGSGMIGNIYAVRIYDRLLTAEEVAQNYRADQDRFLKEVAATVVSGSVTVDGKVYSAGECVPDWRTNTTLHVESASAASVRLADTVMGLSLATGSLGLAGDSVQTLASLELGAGASYSLPGDVLTVTGAITADATASVVGPGLLVGTAATSPVALTGGAEYASTTAAWAGWPSSGSAYIPDGTSVEITAADVANVAALDRIVFGGAYARVTCALNGYTISTPLFGDGELWFVGGGQVYITADNSQFLGCVGFTNTSCVVSNEFGLGGASSRGGRFIATVKDKQLFFGGEHSEVTNRSPVYMSTIFTSAADIYFGAQSSTASFVQTADFTLFEGGTTQANRKHQFRGEHVKFLAKFSCAANKGYIYPGFYPQSNGHLWFLGDFIVDNSGIIYVGASNSRYHFGMTSVGNSPGWFFLGGGDFFVVNDGGAQLSKVNMQQNGANPYHLDLNGIDMDIGKLGHYSGYGNASTAKRTFSLVSATPAQLRFCGSNTVKLNPDVSGAAGITMAGTGSYTLLGMSSKPCTSTGALKVEKGTLTLGDTFEWVGTNVTVSGGALVVGADSPKALSKGVAHLVVTGGTFAAKEGGGVALKSARFGDKQLADGTYTMADLRDDPDIAPFIGSAADDAAEIVVDGEPAGEWEGWHAGDVVVPKMTEVVVTAADLPVISNVTSLTLGNNSRVLFPSLGSIDINFPVSGKGTVSFASMDEVVIFSDNSALVSPGHFEFTNTHVCVSNRFGLGSAATGPCMFYTAVGSANGKRLRFRGPASTNDVAVVFDHCMTFGSDDPSIGTFVQNADIEQTDGGYSSSSAQNKTITPIGSVEFTSAIKLSEVTPPTGSVMRFSSTSSLVGAGSGLALYITSDRKALYLDAPMPAGTRINSLAFYWDYDVYLGADYAISLRSHYSQKGQGSLRTAYGSGNFHMGGHPARIGALEIGNATWTSAAATTTIDSDLPATLFITNILTSAPSYDYYNAVRFTGAVSLDYYSVVATQYLGQARSDTTGSLTVRHGDLVMDYGSYWGGTNVTITGGTLHVGANAATNNVTGACRFFNRKTTLSVSGSGALDIAAGRVERVRCYRLNGEYQPAGDYPMGSGTLRVRRSAPDEGIWMLIR